MSVDQNQPKVLVAELGEVLKSKHVLEHFSIACYAFRHILAFNIDKNFPRARIDSQQTSVVQMKEVGRSGL